NEIILYSLLPCFLFSFFFFCVPASTFFSTLSLHDALPILTMLSFLPMLITCTTPFTRNLSSSRHIILLDHQDVRSTAKWVSGSRSEEHTSELQSRFDLVCRLLLEKKKYLFS